MRILTIVDKVGSAIWRMAEDVKNELDFLDIRVLSLHPKRPSLEEIQAIEEFQPDLLDIQYWKSGEKLFELLPKYKEIPAVLSHHNPYDLMAKDWSHYKKNIVSNLTQKRVLRDAEVVTLSVDSNKFKWNPDYTEEKSVVMCAARIEGKKGILPVAKVCNELGYKFYLVGRISDQNYYSEILKYKPIMAVDATDEELIEIYNKSAIHICNSVDNFETGTLPMLECMSVGVPIITRPIGYIPDVNHEGILVHDSEPENEEALRVLIKNLMEDRELRLSMRDKAWNIIKEKNTYRRAWKLYKIWNSALYKEDLVSVVINTFNRPDNLEKILEAYLDNTWKNIEIIVVDDNSDKPDLNEQVVKNFRQTGLTIKYFNTHCKGYGLAKARNIGILNSAGEYLLFNDDRWLPKKDLIQEFMNKIEDNSYLCANKNNNKKSFVENVSFIKRSTMIKAGMFCERINKYGGMTQEIVTRMNRNGVKCLWNEKAQVTQLSGSKSRFRKKDEILEMKNLLWRMYDKI